MRMLMFISPLLTRRVVLIGSLLPKMKDELDDETLRKINVSLGFHTRGVNFVKFPMIFSSQMWSNSDIEKYLRSDDKDSINLTSYVYQKLPYWMKYSYTDMKKDISITKSILKVQ